jgi:hypothetical protein
VDAGNRTGGHRERGRLDRIELRLDMDDRIVLVAAVEETAEPDLIRQLNVGQWGERATITLTRSSTQGQRTRITGPVLRGSLENVKPSRS